MAPKATKQRPDIAKKQQRVKKILDDPKAKTNLKKKVAIKRAKADIAKVVKAGGDDTRPLRKAKRQKKVARPELVSDKSAETEGV